MSSRLTLVVSDRPVTLVERLALDLARTPLSPFDAETIVVQSQGMTRWVRHELARRHGCAAGLVMPFPAAFAHDLARRVDARPLDERFERDAMTWRILQFLEEGLAEEPEFAALHAFAAKSDTRKRLGLAARLAARFDDYLLYRPDTLLAWERGESVSPDTDATRWQAALWRRVCGDAAEPNHLARWLDSAIARIEAGDVDVATLPRRVSVFGINTLPPCFTRLLQALARHVPVRAYLLAPPRATWDESVNPLFKAFGNASQDLLARLSEGADVEELPRDSEIPRLRSGILATLQRDIRDGVARGREAGLAAPLPLDPRDASLTVHVCHSPMREMEVLRDQLLDAFAHDATLRPHDVLVLVPDVPLYAPFVEAVFGVGEPALPRIPYHVADRPIAQESSVADAALRLLRLVGARWTAAEVVELLDLPTVRRAAGVPASATRRVLEWVEETRIRWGRDGAMRKERFNLPEVDANSWRAGLDRLLMGYATGRTDALVAGVVPHAGDTIGDPATLGALARWADRLFDALDELRDARSLRDWTTALRALFAEFLRAEGDDEEREVAYLVGIVDALASLGDSAGMARVVDLAVVRDWLERELAGESLGAGFLVGGMTVCALKPMRAIPFRVIAIAGLDDASFPRGGRGASYDLLEIEKRAGDRDTRADDRQLFLDTILSAGDRLILSYVGRSATDNSVRAMSVVVAELLDVIDASFDAHEGNAREHVVVEHRLQPFSPAYYEGGASRLFSYSRVNASAAGVAGGGRRAAAFLPETLPLVQRDEHRVVQLRELIDCWTNPSRWFCTRVLGLRLAGGDEPLEDCEPLTVAPLDRFAVHDDMLRRHLRGARDADIERTVATALGRLPSGALADHWFGRLDEEIADFLSTVERSAAYEPVAVEIDGPAWTLVGRIDGLTDAGRTQVRAGKRRTKDLIDAWITHLALAAHTGERVTTRVLGMDGASMFAPVDEPLGLLDALVEGLRSAERSPIPVFEQASRDYVDQQRKLDSGTSRATTPAIDKARTAYFGSDFTGAGDAREAHVELCWRGRDPFADEATFADWAKRLWSPLLTHMSEAES